MEERVDIHVAGYHLTEPIGTGGMGSVFKATVEVDGKPVPKGTTVAVKLLHPHLRSIQEFVRRFHREARLAAKIDHPNVVRVLDVGEEDRKHYIVMEHVEGMKLTDLMGDGQPLSPQQTIEIMNQVCEALKAAGHISDDAEPDRVRSLVHRDVKPDNIIIQPLDRQQYQTMTQTGDKTALASIRVKLLDFGLAKDVKALSTVLSQTGQSLGTPAYMSPEQCTGGQVDARSDIYSLGVCAYHMITGTTPFAGPTTVAYAQQHASEPPPDVLSRNPLCPRNLADCIFRCLAKDPTDRYQDCGQLQADLARVAAGRPVARVHRFKKRGAVSRRKTAAIGAVGAAVVLLAVVALWLFMTDQVKADLAEAIRQADTAIASEDYVGAQKILSDAIDAVGDRPDREALIAPAARRLQEIAARAAEQDRRRRAADELAAKRKREQDALEAKRRHEQAAVAALADIKAKIAREEWQQAIDAANRAIRDYADTPSAAELGDLLARAEAGLKARQKALAAEEAERQKRLAAQRKAAHERFVTYRDAGLAAMKDTDYHAAVRQFDLALEQEDDAAVRTYRQQCLDKVTKLRIAVADFDVKGDVSIRAAGETVPELLLQEFGQDRFQLVERSKLAAILAEHDLTIARVVSNPALLSGKKLKGLRYLVLGSVVRLGSLAISARLVDVATGDMVQTAKVTAEDARGLQGALGELARILQMTADEKKVYLDARQYPILLAQARQQAADRQFDQAVRTYRRALSIRSTQAVQDELDRVEADRAAWEKAQADAKRADAAFTALMAEAGRIVAAMPAEAGSLTASQKSELAQALKAVQSALAYKPADRGALALKARVNALLAGPAGGKTLTLTLGDGVTMKLVRIEAGKFTMGSETGSDEKPVHQVTITRPFYMGATEVTQAQWKAVMNTQPWEGQTYAKAGADNAASYISWDEATAFCTALSKKAGRTVRLPTEAEWEYACRADTTTAYCFGDDSSKLGDYAWYNENAWKKDEKYAHPVGVKKPNAWGLYDMHGNVWEWCADWYANSYANADAHDPKGPATGTARVLRGGSWGNDPGYCRAAIRRGFAPGLRRGSLGFRVVVASASGVD